MSGDASGKNEVVSPVAGQVDVSLRQKAAAAQQLAIQYFRAGNLQSALNEGQKAADIETGNAQLQNLVGAIAIETNEPATAVQYLQRSLFLNEHQAEAQYLLGNAFIKLNLDDQAILAFNYALALEPTHANAAMNLGLCHNRQGDTGKSERAFKRAIEIVPNHPEANHSLSELYIRKTQYDKAEEHARLAIEGAPDRVELILVLAKALRSQKEYSEAEKVYRAALVRHPHNALLMIEIGGVLREQHEFIAAEREYEKALELAPKNKDVLRSAGAFYQSLRKHQLAAEMYSRYLDLVPDDPGMLNNIAITMRDLDRFEEAEEYYLKAIELDDNPAYAYNNLAVLAMEMSRPIDSINYYRKALKIKPQYAAARSNMLFYLNYMSDVTPQELYKEHCEWERWHTEPLRKHACVHGNDPDPERRLKIGYLSADLYGHAVSYFIEAALKNHNKEQFEVYCYARVGTPDGITERLMTYPDHWRSISGLDTETVVDLIRDDEIDILVDLSGHTGGNMLSLFALKPAPIQVTWIGYPNTTGLTAIDYRFVDPITDPVGDADTFHSETLWRLPESFTCYTSQSAPPLEEKLSALSTGHITFGSFNNASKLSSCTLRTWAKILLEVEDAELILKSSSLVDKETQKRIWGKFDEYGVSPDRVKMMGKMPSNEHMRLYDKVDIALDPFPYNGTTTSCEALLMGSPIIAIFGDRHASRVTASLLTQVGLGDLVGADEDDYVKKAVALANDLDRLQDIRKNLRTNMEKSPLCDGPRHTRAVEDAYREMWKIWCTEEPGRREQRRKDGFSETVPHKSTLRIVHSLGDLSVAQFCQCLGVMDNVHLLSDLHPLGVNVFPPLEQSQERYSLFSPEEWEVLPVKKITFTETLHRIFDKVEERDGTVVMTNWCHLDFIAQPFLASPSYEMFTVDKLSSDFEILDIFLVRHPIALWKTYCDYTNVSEHVNVDEFLRGYRHFAEFAAKGKMYRCEDFVINPDTVLSEVCEHLQIPYDPAYKDNWFFNTKISGNPIVRTLHSRALETLKAPIPDNLDPQLLRRIEDNSDYQIILDLLGYD